MASTYSTNLGLELITTGEQAGTWGTTTNTNLGTLIEQAISGYVTQAITDGSGANTTITMPDGATGVARNMFIEMTGALTFSTTSLIVPADRKLYFIYNNTTGGFAVTVKVTGLTGVSVPNGRKVILVCNGTDIVEAHNAVSGNATVGGTLAVTGATTLTGAATLSSTLGVTGATTLSAGLTVTGGRSQHAAVSEPYAVGVKFSSVGGSYYFGAASASATPDGVFSNAGGSERMRITDAGIVTMSAYGAGTATFSSAGVISSVSDETWKIKDGSPVDPDSMINKLEPGYWFYNDEKKEIFGVDRQLGFYAQNVNAAIGPEAAPLPEEGKAFGYYDRSILAVVVMSLQKALATIETLEERITALETA